MADTTPDPQPESNWLKFYVDWMQKLVGRAADAGIEARIKLGEELIALGSRMIITGEALVNEANRSNDPPSTD